MITTGLIHLISGMQLLVVDAIMGYTVGYSYWIWPPRLHSQSGTLVLICDYYWSSLSNFRSVYVGGGCYDGLGDSVSCLYMRDVPSHTKWVIGAYL